ncbi:MAG: NAD(P)H-binding protein [Bacteroidota bacterium]
MSIAITTPTGHIGRQLVDHLLAHDEPVIVLLREAAKLPAAVRERVTTYEGVLQDPAYVQEATQGADALFWLSPNHITAPSMYGWYEEMAQAATSAIAANGIGHVVHLSSQGAHHRDGMGPVSGLGRVEEALDATEAAVRHLRPTFFMENFEAQLGAIQQAGAVFFPAPPETTTGMIATQDIARTAADWLIDRSWQGTDIVPLHGPRDYSYAEAAAVLTEALGRPVRAQQVPPEAVREQVLGYGASPDYADALVTLYTRIGRPEYVGSPRSAATTTPTTLETYVRTTLRPMLG